MSHSGTETSGEAPSGGGEESEVLRLAQQLAGRRPEQEEVSRLRREAEEARSEAGVLRQNAALDEETIAELRAKLERRAQLYRVTAEELERLKDSQAALTSWKSTEGNLRSELEAARREMLEYKHRLEDSAEERAGLERRAREAEGRLAAAEEQVKGMDVAQAEELRTLHWELAREREVKTELSDRLKAIDAESTVKKAELHSLRERLNTETPVRKTLRRTSSREDLLVAEVARLRAQIEQLAGRDPDKLVTGLSEELGSLRAHQQRDQERLQELQAEKASLATQAELLRAQVKDLEDELARLKRHLSDRETETTQTHDYLVDEISKIKLQKADLRCRFLELERKQGLIAAGQLSAPSTPSKGALEKERRVGELERELFQANERLASLNKQMEELGERLSSAEQGKKSERSRVVELETERLTLLETVEELDRQCEELERLRARERREAGSLVSEAVREEAEKDAADARATARTIAQLAKEKEREAEKAAQLQAELIDTHKDYRDQLALLTAKLSDAAKAAATASSSTPSSRPAPDSRVPMLEASLKDANKEVKSLERRLNESERDAEKTRQELAEIRQTLAKMTEERNKAANNLRFAIEKAEKFKAEKEEALRDKEAMATMATALSDKPKPKSPANPDPFNRGPQIELDRKLQQVRNKYNLSSPEGPSSAHNPVRIQPPRQKVSFREPAPPPPAPPPPPPAPAAPAAFQQPSYSRTALPAVASARDAEEESEDRSVTPISTDSSHLTYDSEALAQQTAPVGFRPPSFRRSGRTAVACEPHQPLPYIAGAPESQDDTASLASESLSCTSSEASDGHALTHQPSDAGDAVQLIHSGPLADLSHKSPSKAAAHRPNTASSHGSQGSQGTMRHNIPHRWKRFLVLYPVKCLVCMDGLSVFRHGYKCSDCSIVVHSPCAQSLLNTCGLPMHLTEYYMDSLASAPATPQTRRRQSIMETPSEEGRMTGWVKLWRSFEPAGRWRDVWGCMDAARLVFYPDDSKYDEPVEVIQLEKQRWKIHFERGIEREDASAVERNDLPFLVEIKVTPDDAATAPYRLYVMCPTLPAKQRWVNALQVATTRKLFARRVSSLKLRQNSFLPLPSLDVRCVAPLNEKHLLIATDQGLFFTSLRSPGAPLPVHGVKGKILGMELLPSVDILVLITGETDRQLSLVHSSELGRSLAAAQESGEGAVASAVAPFPDLSVLHRMCSLETGKGLYLVVADPNAVHVLKFSSRIGSFKVERSLATEEPVSCLEPFGERVLVGAERFYLLEPRSGLLQEFYDPEDASLAYVVRTAPARKEFPTAATVVSHPSTGSDGEILVSYQNFGLFVDGAGRRTRRQSVEWLRSPLELALTQPYLFVFHFESVQVFLIPELRGLESAPLEAVAMLELGSPQLMGRGPAEGDLFVAARKDGQAQAHLLLFNAFAKAESGGFLKRKALHQHNPTRKRSKD